jgi:general secretion pathway protein J
MIRTSLPPRPGRLPARLPCVGTEAGFTLLEIIVAIVVLAMIMTTAFGALRLGDRSWEAGMRRAGESEQLRSTGDLLRRQFNQITPMVWNTDNEPRIAFNGDRTRVQFIAPAPQHHGATGLFEFTLSAENGADGVHLVLNYTLFNPDHTSLGPPDSGRRVLLAESLKSVELEYYGSRKTDEAPAWHMQWDAGQTMYPELVRLRVERESGALQWPELLLSLRTGQAQ